MQKPPAKYYQIEFNMNQKSDQVWFILVMQNGFIIQIEQFNLPYKQAKEKSNMMLSIEMKKSV